jgi:hypothetical protein
VCRSIGVVCEAPLGASSMAGGPTWGFSPGPRLTTASGAHREQHSAYDIRLHLWQLQVLRGDGAAPQHAPRTWCPL